VLPLPPSVRLHCTPALRLAPAPLLLALAGRQALPPAAPLLLLMLLLGGWALPALPLLSVLLLPGGQGAPPPSQGWPNQAAQLLVKRQLAAP
jgi:hypothetical protein